MTSTLIDGIGQLVTNDPQNPAGDGERLGVIGDAAIVVRDGEVEWAGPRAHAPACDNRHDVDGRAVIPGFVDSHSHLVFAGDRVGEFEARMSGLRYAAGGILTTVEAVRVASDDALRTNARRLRAEMAASGTTTVEIKSGYGLTITDEVRSVSIARELTDESTFLGAHVVPPEFADRREDYVELLTGDMLDACANSVRWIDVFCDRGAFDVDEAREILDAGKRHGLTPRLHANQLEHSNAILLGVELGAASVDHCNFLDDTDVAALAASGTVATVLPAADFSTRSQYADARRLLDAGVTVAIATDCNPGTSYTTSMPFCLALAVREMRMTPREALWSATAGGALALLRDDVGAIRPGVKADFAVLDAPSYAYLAYRPGVQLVAETWKNGSVWGRRR